MATLSDTRLTILEIVNEVRRKLGLREATSLTMDKHSRVAVDYLNDVIDEVSDYADWQETYQTFTLDAVTSVYQYTIATSAAIKNIREVSFEGRVAPLRSIEIEDMRRLRRVGGVGQPHSWCINGTADDGNPTIEIYPQPGTSESGSDIAVAGYTRPRQYTTSDGSVVPSYPARMLVQGLLAYMLLDEDRGTQGSEYTLEYSKFLKMLSETHNRYNGDSGNDVTVVAGR